MPYKDIDPDDINKPAGRKANAAVKEAAGDEAEYSDSEEVWKLWFKIYEENGGKTRIIEEKGTSYSMLLKCEPPRIVRQQPKLPEPEVIPPLTLKIVELEFLSDHKVIKNNTTDWKITDDAFVKPDWTPEKSNAISHSINERARVRIVVEAEGTAPDSGRIAAKFLDKRFFMSGKTVFKIGRNELTLVSETDLFSKLSYGKAPFEWLCTTSRKPESTPIGTTENYILTTFSKPISQPTEPDDCITVFRMKKSIDLVKKTGTTDPHMIVTKLMGIFDGYTLEKHRSVPAEFGHPHYTHAEIGAWALADYTKYSAECQAICRFVRGVIEQVGCPGTVEPIVVWEDPLENAVKEAVFGSSRSGLRFVMKTIPLPSEQVTVMVKVTEELGMIDRFMNKEPVVRMVPTTKTVSKKETWRAFLTTSKPKIGADATDCGLNLYEACLKFTHNGISKYHGGGAGTYDSKEGVIRAFNSLIWVLQVTPEDENLPVLMICKEIVKAYR